MMYVSYKYVAISNFKIPETILPKNVCDATYTFMEWCALHNTS